MSIPRTILSIVVTFVASAGVGTAAELVYPPELIAGPILIHGGGELSKSTRDAFVKIAGKESHLVIIPTASESADDAKKSETFTQPWKEAGFASISVLHTRDPKQANDPKFIQPLTKATAVWFTDGDTAKLVAAYRGTLVEKELWKLHRAGKVIGGTSAGAAVMSDVTIPEIRDSAAIGQGFGFIPGIVIDPHFSQKKRQSRLAGVIEKQPTYVGLGLDEGTTVIVVQGRFLAVQGDGVVSLALAKSSTKPAVMEPSTGGAFDYFQLRRAAHFRNLKEPFPSAKAADPIVPKGSLVIVGGGGAGPEIWKKFIDLAGGPDAKLVVVTSANEDPVPLNPVELQALQKNGAKNVTTFHTRDRKKSDSAEFCQVIRNAKGVWFSGGRQWRFIDSYEGTLAGREFHQVLERGGVIGGSSAGASIQSEYMPRGHPLGNTVMAAEGYERGLGFLPGCAVDQHFFARKRTGDMTGLMKQYPQLLGIGIDEGTAIVVQGSTAEVIGRTKVGFYDYRQKPKAGDLDYVEVKTGGKYDLLKRTIIK